MKNPQKKPRYLKQIFALALLTVVLASCSDNNEMKPSQESRIAERPTGINKITRDPVTGKTNAADFISDDVVWVTELPDPAELERAHALQAGRVGLPVTPAGMISSTQAFRWPTNAPASAGVEKQVEVLPGYVITGIGATIASSSNNYAYIAIQVRYLYSDGTFGTRYMKWSNNQATTIDNLEAWVELDYGQIFCGLGMRGKYDVKHMTVYYKYYDRATNRLYGGGINKKLFEYEVSGLEVTDAEKAAYRPFVNDQLTYLPDWYDGTVYENRSVILGVGLMSNDGGTTLMEIDEGFLK